VLRAALIAGVVFIVYALGACPTIYVGDSGELVTAVHLLGVPHPTGYPLYVLLGKAWTLVLPVGSIAWRMSVFSAVCAAMACAVLARLGDRLGLHPVAAAFGALLLAFSPSFWAEANVQRVYALNAVFVVLATAAACRWFAPSPGSTPDHDHRSFRALALAFFLCGLGATNHTFMVFYALALGVFVLVTAPVTLLRWQAILGAGAAFAVGLLPYAYLPIRSRWDPRLDWGDPETLQKFLAVVLRQDFWERAWIEGPADAIPIAADYLRSLATELTWIGAALAVVGLVVGRRRGWPVLLPVLVMLGNVIAVGLHGSRSDIFIWHRYYIPSYAMGALLAAAGCHALIERLPQGLRLLPLALPAVQLAVGWPVHDRSRYRIAEEFGTAVLDSLPPGAHLVATDDNILFALLYMHLVEGKRPDVDLVPQGIGSADLPPLRFDPTTDPLFFTHHPNWNLPSLDLVPVGLLFRAWRGGAAPPPLAVPANPLPGADDPRVPKDYLTQNLIGQFHYMLGFTAAERDWRAARRQFEAAAAAAPHNDVLFYNLGLIYWRHGRLDDAIAAFERSREINPRHLASHGRPEASAKIEELRAERARIAAIEATLVADDPALRAAAPGSPSYHRRLAELLRARGETLAAQGQELRALEIEADLR
jgi:tetratricopeptide (TPR) repeat protein